MHSGVYTYLIPPYSFVPSFPFFRVIQKKWLADILHTYLKKVDLMYMYFMYFSESSSNSRKCWFDTCTLTHSSTTTTIIFFWPPFHLKWQSKDPQSRTTTFSTTDWTRREGTCTWVCLIVVPLCNHVRALHGLDIELDPCDVLALSLPPSLHLSFSSRSARSP